MSVVCNPHEQALLAAQAAITAATQAYQFNPGSYTYEGLLQALKVRDVLAGAATVSEPPDWMADVLDWNERSQ
jgi:hypothetical protein